MSKRTIALLAVFGAGIWVAPSAQAWVRRSAGEQSQPAENPAGERLEAIVERLKKTQQEVYTAYRNAATDAERAQILQGLPGAEFAAEFRGVAETARGTDTAARAWIWVLRLTVDKNKQEALETLDVLITEYEKSPALEELPAELRYAHHSLGKEPVLSSLRTLAERSPHIGVRAGALFTLGAVLVELGDDASKTEGRGCLQRVVAEYGDVESGGTSTFGSDAQRHLFELDHLQIGMVAPDFNAVDETGAAFKLSDYRGKVVVVDFWGFW